MLFFTVLRRCLRRLALHDFIFCLNKLWILSRASLLALAKSIYYVSKLMTKGTFLRNPTKSEMRKQNRRKSQLTPSESICIWFFRFIIVLLFIQIIYSYFKTFTLQSMQGSRFHLPVSKQIQSWLVHIVLKFSYFFFVNMRNFPPLSPTLPKQLTELTEPRP